MLPGASRRANKRKCRGLARDVRRQARAALARWRAPKRTAPAGLVLDGASAARAAALDNGKTLGLRAGEGGFRHSFALACDPRIAPETSSAVAARGDRLTLGGRTTLNRRQPSRVADAAAGASRSYLGQSLGVTRLSAHIIGTSSHNASGRVGLCSSPFGRTISSSRMAASP